MGAPPEPDWFTRRLGEEAKRSERLMGEILDVIEETNGRLNFNDALLVALQRERQIDEVASFDRGSDTGQGGHPDSAKRS